MSPRRNRDIRVPTPWLDPRPPPPLPRLVIPLQDETLTSYLSRVAEANHVPHFAILDRLVPRPPDTDEDPLVWSRWIAALCGIDQQRLLRAVPDLRVGRVGPDGPLPVTGRPIPRQARDAPPCRFCAATRGALRGRLIDPQVWASIEDNVCRTHQIWIGAGVSDYDQQIDLRALPEITQAQTRHRRLIRRRGRPATFTAFLDARRIWFTLEWVHDYSTERDQRLRRYLGPDTDPDALDYDDPLHYAATYPEIVAFTSLLASPYWSKKVLHRRPEIRQTFQGEFTRRVTPNHPQPDLLERLVRERLTDPHRRYRISDRETLRATSRR